MQRPLAPPDLLGLLCQPGQWGRWLPCCESGSRGWDPLTQHQRRPWWARALLPKACVQVHTTETPNDNSLNTIFLQEAWESEGKPCGGP